jgi:threonine aldolase
MTVKRIVDLRSDTVTQPTPAMRRAMAEAEVGDDVYGEDPTVNRLQERAAVLMGKEAALFVPSGSMGNQVAVKVHTQIGEEVVCETECHIYLFETGMMAAFSGVLPRFVRGERGIMDPGAVRAAIRSPKYYLPKTALLCAENSHNVAGGTVMTPEQGEELGAVAREYGLATHLDGARIFNAAKALGVEARVLAAPFDSVMFCISKGLCAPVGSLLCGSRDFVEKARKVRKMMGGGMRQAGILAAAGLVAFEEIVPRLGEDHLRARKIAEALADHPAFAVDLAHTPTNIVRAEVKAPRTPEAICGTLAASGILASPASATTVRFVTHQDIDDEGVALAIRAIRDMSA